MYYIKMNSLKNMYYIIKWIHLKYVLYYKMNSLKVCTIL